MFKALVFISALTSVVLAQSSTSSNGTTSSLIPSDVSPGCSAFLNAFNNDPSIATCVSTLSNITSVYSPGSSAPSSQQLSSTLANFCGDSVTSTCPDSLIRQNLTAFYAACSAELTTDSNSQVRQIYDILYTMVPLRTSVCSKDTSGNYCAAESSTIARRDQLTTDFIPNITLFTENNLQFIFYQADLNATELCTSCARQIITAYINFESDSPYASGLNSSSLLGTQSALYNAIVAKCPTNFLTNSGAEAAGGLSGSPSSAISTYGAGYQRLVALLVGGVTMIVFFAL